MIAVYLAIYVLLIAEIMALVLLAFLILGIVITTAVSQHQEDRIDNHKGKIK